MARKRPTQCQRIVDYIKRYGYITRLEAANELFIFELSSRIIALQDRGFVFKKERVSRENRFGEKKSFTKYSIEKEGSFV